MLKILDRMICATGLVIAWLNVCRYTDWLKLWGMIHWIQQCCMSEERKMTCSRPWKRLPGNEIDHKRILDKRGSHTFIDMIASRLALFDNETTKHLITRVKDRLLIGGGETERIWIITEADRSVTTLLLREEY